MSWAQLVRLPTVFTAMADIFLGYLITKPDAALHTEWMFFVLLGASVCHYWTGMIMNDFFDREVDGKERPNRPIPSGRVSAPKALRAAVTLNIVGFGLAGIVGEKAMLTAGFLTLAIWLYNGVLKSTPLAPIIMGSCRFFNVLFGASSGTMEHIWCPQVQVALGLGVFVCGLTIYARQEAKESSRPQLTLATAVVAAGLTILAHFIVTKQQAGLAVPEHGNSALILLAVISLTIFRRLIGGISDPSPQRVQLAVKVMLLSLVTLDATVVFFVTSNPTYAVLTATLIIPARVLAGRIPMT
ncbi:MAG: UbiA family prenyltransferase [Planctomycetes bacterium]|nr:UbiA family prenyltransferase [Planctomycetota bacterium]